MALVTNFNANPYYDDFDEDKKFLRLLFRPGYAVQARELTQIQTLMQNQFNRFGNWAFKNGSVVTGGQFVNQNATYINLSPVYVETSVVANNFLNQTILSIDESKRAKVLKVYNADEGTGEPITLMVASIYGEDFVSGETIKTNELTPYFANTTGVGTGQIFSVDQGVYYYDGFFIQTDPQTVAVSKYSTVGANVRCGFEVTESIVSSSSDTSLLDPAQDASNYQAPGADRYKIDLVLSTRDLESTDDERFIELQRVEESVVTETYSATQLAVLGDILAKRTFDESGNYTINPFIISLQTNASNSANMDIILSPGRAYVYGYEFTKIAPTVITVEKPRESTNVQNKRVSADYGYFFYTNNHYNTFPINHLSTIDIHCVAQSAINTHSTATIANTKIGTARVKNVAYDSSANSANAQTYEFKTYIFDLQINDNITGNVISANSSLATLSSNVRIANASVGLDLSATVNAYQGARLRIIAGPGTGEEPKLITSWDPTTGQLELDSRWGTVPTTESQYEIDFEVLNAKSLVNYSGTTLVASANIDERSTDASTIYNYTYITDSNFEPLLFRLGESFIKQNTVSDLSMSYRRLYESQSFSSSVSPSLPVSTGESIASASAVSTVAQNYLVTIVTQGTSPYPVGSIVPSTVISVNTSTRQLTVLNGNNMVANIIATIDATGDATTAKRKTYITGNTTIQTSGGIDVFGNGAVTLFANAGQVHIANTFINRVPSGVNSLFASDLTEITQILDFEGAAISEANKSGATDVSTKYQFDTGQRNSVYDHSSIRLRPKTRPPVGPLVVFFNRFTSSGPGFFTVDSYTANNVANFPYGNIPLYASPTLSGVNANYQLRDVLDFRPVRKDAVASGGSAVVFDVDASTTGPKIPDVGSDIILDYEYYLPRTDKVILHKTEDMTVVKGISSLNPPVPKDVDSGMTLYILENPPYVANTSDVNTIYVNNKRYTMRDIGTIESRVKNLEYYTSLSLLEQDAFNKQDLTMRDTENVLRFKNGILVDAFTGSSVADILNDDYNASIDPVNNELRPSFNLTAHSLEFDSANSQNYFQGGPILAANTAEVAMINQPKSSRFININPFNVVNFIGTITLNPPSDFWVDTERRADVLVNIGGDLDAWENLVEGAATTEWGSWRRVSGQTLASITQAGAAGRRVEGNAIQRGDITTTITEETQRRSGVTTTTTVEQITRSLGDRVVDVSIIPFMRRIPVLFTGVDFRPSTTLYTFFDGVAVEKYVAQANRFYLSTNNVQLKTTTANSETIIIRDTSTNAIKGRAEVVLTSNNIAYVVAVTPTATFDAANTSFRIEGQTSGLNYNVTGYEHNYGLCRGSSSSSITLDLDAGGAKNISDYNGSVIFITQGTGAGQEATISSYNPSTRVATISGSWTTNPASGSSIYSIGRPKTDVSGSIAGVYTIPEGQFRIGEKLFRLVDVSTGDLTSSRTNGSQTFFAQGLLQTVQNVNIQTIVPNGTRQGTTSEDRSIVRASQTTNWVTIGYLDPLAQTFLVSPVQYPQGVFLSKLRFCFKSKDPIIPVTLQLRPVVNGYPSSSEIYPFSTVSLTPDKVKITDSPDLDDPTKYTDFVFDAPLFLQPGEHSFVLLANSNEYETYSAEIGKKDLVTQRQISEQPYGGSLFASQNGSTWTADQSSDLMFRMFRYRFDQVPADVRFLVKYPEGIVRYDLMQLITNEVVTQNTAISYSFNSQTLTADYAGFKSVIPLEDYDMNDGAGTRALLPATGNSTFELAGLLSTVNPDISPFIDVTRLGFVGVENQINDLELSNNDINIISGGSGYANSSDVTVTISGGNGFGATAEATVTDGVVTDIYIVDAGSGYTATPTITITAGGGGGSGASAVVVGETSKSGGPALARYITRRVTLAEGFDSGDLRVYLSAYKPSNSGIHVYAKYLSSSDSELFEDKEWQLLTQIGDVNFVSTSSQDFREFTFAPGATEEATNKISYTNNAGSTFFTFKTFAIKIVMTSQLTYDVPRIRDLRVIALPARTESV